MVKNDKGYDDKLEIPDFSVVLEKDENEKRYEKAKKHLFFLRQKKKTIRLTILLVIIVIVAIYFVSDISNVKVITIEGSNYYTNQEIMKQVDLSYSDKTIFYPSILIKHRLENNPVIDKVKVSKNLTGGIFIKIKEKKVLGYYNVGNKIKLVLDNDEIIEVDKKNKLFDNIPYLHNLSNQDRNEICKELKSLSVEDISLISEIHKIKNKNKDTIELVMVDGHRVRCDLDGIKYVKSYKKIIKGLNSKLKCINIIEETKSAYTEKCD